VRIKMDWEKSYIELLSMIPEEVLPLYADDKTSHILLKELLAIGLLEYMRAYNLIKDVD
jgi:hypothetical protein